MYSSPGVPIPKSSILEEHVRVLREAADASEDWDVRSAAVYEALDGIEAMAPHLKWRCTQFRRALEIWSPADLREAYRRIERES